MKVTSVLLIWTSALLHVSTSQILDCPSEGIAYISHSKCTKFIICVDGEVTEMTCPFSLYYNPETSRCDFFENVVECRGGTRPPISTTSTLRPTTTTTTTKRPPGELTNCGQSIIADNGTIRYKLHEPYDAGELCVFMIRFESGAVNTTFKLDTHGLNELDTDALTILSLGPALGFQANLGIHLRNISFIGYGAVVVFRTNSNLGTGFQLHFKRDVITYPAFLSGTNVAFNNEENSPLNIPYLSEFSGEIYNCFVFTSGSKKTSDPKTLFRLAVRAWADKDTWCSKGFWVYSFVNELTLEENICPDLNEEKIYRFATRGIFIVYQQQLDDPPVVNGSITWITDSTL